MEKARTRLGKFDKWGYKNSFSKGELARELTYMNEDYADLQTQLKKQKEIIDKAIEDLKFYQSKAYDEENDIRYDEIQSTIDILEHKEV